MYAYIFTKSYKDVIFNSYDFKNKKRKIKFMNYNNYTEDKLYLKNFIEEKILLMNPDDDDEYATQEELDALENDMFPDGVDDDNYPDLSDSD